SSSTSGSSSRTSSGSSSSAPTDKATRVRQYAGSLFKKYDVDKDGFLNKEEISQNPSVDIAADTNRDGLIAAAEFETHMLSRNGVSSGLSSTGSGSTARSEGSSDGRSRSGRSRDTDSGRSDSRRSRGIPTALAPLATINGQPTRFMTPTERLPEGLPSWFALKDLDADGQISMGEYSKTWSEAKLREYTEIDSNNDGVITPAECLAGSNSEER
ncbi:MAG: hypothetical protein SGJ20_19795, partial [Planctomycetota bacterium]|nr:hypothetical protein [Planctomycetota bacterium]